MCRRFLRTGWVLVVLALAAAPLSRVAAAEAPPGEIVDLAKRRYETGKWLYQHGQYPEALVEFRAARAVAERPELDYNIGLCEEQLGHAEAAAEAYRRFVEQRPGDPEAGDVRARIARLDAQLLAVRPVRSIRKGLAIGLGATGLALVAVGIGTGAVVLSSRDDGAAWDRNHALAITTDVLLPVGGVLALSGLVVYLVDRRARGPRR